MEPEDDITNTPTRSAASTANASGGLAGLQRIWAELPTSRRWLIGGVAAAAFIGLLAMTVAGGGDGDWRPIARSMVPEEQERALTTLSEAKVPHRLGPGGTLLVPSESVHSARLALAMNGGAGGGSVGFEIFDQADMGRSAFSERVNYHRALEGELSRTVRQIDGIERARVHLVMPKRRAFRQNDAEPSASVSVQLRHGHRLVDRQAQAIRQLIAASVERLSPDAVAIMDQYGTMLAAAQAGDMGLSGANYEHKAGMERQLEARVKALLEPAAGAGMVRAQVALRMDFAHIVETRESYDPEKQVVRSERERVEGERSSSEKPGGAPGTATNLPRGGAAQAATTNTTESSKDKTDTIRNYDIDKNTIRRETPTPRVERMSIAVLVGERPNADGTGTVPRSDAEIARYKQIVASAVGLDVSRGDQIEVVSVAFVPPEDLSDPVVVAPEPMIPEALLMWGAIGLGVLLLLGLVLFFWLRGRRRRKTALALQEEDKALDLIVGSDEERREELETLMPDESRLNIRERIRLLRARAVELGMEDTRRLAIVLENWLDSDDVPTADKQEAA